MKSLAMRAAAERHFAKASMYYLAAILALLEHRLPVPSREASDEEE